MQETDRKILKALSEGLPIVPEPFEEAGRGIGLSGEEMVDALLRLIEDGVVRRFGAVVRHRKMGYEANAMVVWKMDADEIDGAGERIASHDFVSHCYRRGPAAEFPFNLYAMVHGRDGADVKEKVRTLEAAVGKVAGGVFRSLREYKKTSLQLLE